MRKRLPLWPVALLLAGIATALILLDSPSEPSYAGRPASDRIAALRTGGNLLSGLRRWETAV
jgi:hypothetical protein